MKTNNSYFDQKHFNSDSHVVWLHSPRLVGRVDEHYDGSVSVTAIEWMDPPPENPTESARLMRKVGDCLAK